MAVSLLVSERGSGMTCSIICIVAMSIDGVAFAGPLQEKRRHTINRLGQ